MCLDVYHILHEDDETVVLNLSTPYFQLSKEIAGNYADFLLSLLCMEFAFYFLYKFIVSV